MEEIKIPFHEHLVRPTTRFLFKRCDAEWTDHYRIYGGYRCNEPGCSVAFHKECPEALPEIINSFHPEHPLKLIQADDFSNYACSLCLSYFSVGYKCSICDFFHIDLKCVRKSLSTENSCLHEHPLKLTHGEPSDSNCAVCVSTIGDKNNYYYRCHQCKFAIHLQCVDDAPEAYHTSHPQHPLKSISSLPDYADIKCLLCGKDFETFQEQLHHCDVCNFSICRVCMILPPQVCVVSSTTHEHQLMTSHPHPLYYVMRRKLGCDEDKCDFSLKFKDAVLPKKVVRNRYDDHPLFLSYGESNVNGEYWCEACEAKLDPKEWFYTCNDCGITLHVPCVVGDFSYIKHGTKVTYSVKTHEACYVSNTSICRPFCAGCSSRCMLPTIIKVSKFGGFVYVCSENCLS